MALQTAAQTEMVTLQVPGIPRGWMAVLAGRAQASGESVPEYVRALIEKDVDVMHPDATFDEIMAPVHEEFERSGMTEEELYAMLEEIREDVWQEQHGRPPRTMEHA